MDTNMSDSQLPCKSVRLKYNHHMCQLNKKIRRMMYTSNFQISGMNLNSYPSHQKSKWRILTLHKWLKFPGDFKPWIRNIVPREYIEIMRHTTKATISGDIRNGRCGGFSLPDVVRVSIVVMQGRCVRIISKIVSKSCLCPLPAAQIQWTII